MLKKDNLEEIKDNSLDNYNLFKADLQQTFINNVLLHNNKEFKLCIANHTIVFLKSLCSQVKFKDSYLNLACWLIADKSNNENFFNIINDAKISFFDKIAFSLRFIKIDELKEILPKHVIKAQSQGLFNFFIFFFKLLFFFSIK